MAKGKLMVQLLVIDCQIRCISIDKVYVYIPLPFLLNPDVRLIPPGSISLPFLHDNIVKIVTNLTGGCLQIQIDMISTSDGRIK